MEKWEDFEIQCTNYLNNRFGAYAKFIHQGGTDSTIPDILVKTNSNRYFYIEAKCVPAQCGQFVLLPDIQNNTFRYSSQNASRINSHSLKIMEHMNNYFDEFRNAGTTGKDIIMKNGAEIFSNWIIQYYKEKGVEFFITNEYVIFPIEHFLDYFDVTAKYRIKRSGSSSVGKSLVTYFAELLSNNNTHNYCITNVRIDGTKLFVKSNRELHNKRFICGEYEYMFSQRNSEYELRKLSNTYNANVIFSIKRKNNNTGLDDEAFEYLLK